MACSAPGMTEAVTKPVDDNQQQRLVIDEHVNVAARFVYCATEKKTREAYKYGIQIIHNP